ncbi:uncharacterized protein LOC113794826 [Dermatophagoides pteronyssinus]|uniref:uncharacterized protein LOC113794826 n=1 Tax=Dermatophagoides pteronyssinus TaxID=6956 RepID=UPI003F6723FC
MIHSFIGIVSFNQSTTIHIMEHRQHFHHHQMSSSPTTITMTSTIAAAKLDAQRSISSMSTHSNDSYLLQRANGVNGIYDRGRSPSPTEFFRTKLENYNHIWIREHELNEFIHNGIQKFLDKQAVRDLIHAYDLDDIFINGEEHFFENIYNEFDINNGNNGNYQVLDDSRINARGKFSKLIDVYNSQMMKAANVYPKKFVDKQQKQQQLQQQQQKQRQQQQLVAVHWRKNRKIIGFFTTILIHMFGIKTRHLAHQRRESDQLNAMLEKQSKENQQNN